jgi:hypothetical protein
MNRIGELIQNVGSLTALDEKESRTASIFIRELKQQTLTAVSIL